MKHWKIKHTDKLIFFVLIILVSLLIFGAIVLRGQIKTGGTFRENAMYISIGFSLFILAWALTFPRLVLKKKIPLQIDISDDNDMIVLGFRKNKKITMNLNEISFSIFNYNYYSVLVFHKKIISTKGHLIYKEYLNIVGLKYGFGWKTKTIKEISDCLDSLNVQRQNEKDKGFLNRILWNN